MKNRRWTAECRVAHLMVAEFLRLFAYVRGLERNLHIQNGVICAAAKEIQELMNQGIQLRDEIAELKSAIEARDYESMEEGVSSYGR